MCIELRRWSIIQQIAFSDIIFSVDLIYAYILKFFFLFTRLIFNISFREDTLLKFLKGWRIRSIRSDFSLLYLIKPYLFNWLLLFIIFQNLLVEERIWTALNHTYFAGLVWAIYLNLKILYSSALINLLLGAPSTAHVHYYDLNNIGVLSSQILIWSEWNLLIRGTFDNVLSIRHRSAFNISACHLWYFRSVLLFFFMDSAIILHYIDS